jgi:hypothetical protein
MTGRSIRFGGILFFLCATTAITMAVAREEPSVRPPDPSEVHAHPLISPEFLSPSGRLLLPVVRTAASMGTLDAPLPLPAFASAADPAATLRAQECPGYAPILQTNTDRDREFYLTRGAYSGRGGSRWATDFEKADRQFLVVLRRLMPIDAFPCENPVRLDDPNLRHFPFLFMVEVGSMGLTPPEVEGLRSYLLAGGFLLIDDFWGTQEWNNFEYEISRVFPERDFPDQRIVEVPMDHSIFNVVYPVEEILQVPSLGNARRGIYSERDGYVPHMRGIFNEDGRLMVAISWNSDLIDAWEWAEDPDYPWDRSNYAFQVGFNLIVYAMTH